MGPFSQRTPFSKLRETELLDTQVFFGVREPWVRPLEISWNIATENGCLEYDCFVLSKKGLFFMPTVFSGAFGC